MPLLISVYRYSSFGYGLPVDRWPRNGAESDIAWLLVASGNRRWKLESGKTGEHLVRVQLPRDLTCAHCSLTYVAGNNWGWCGDGTGALGCGPQETFRTCSDVSILESSDVRLYEGFDYCSRASRSLNSISVDEIPESDVEGQD